MYASTPHARGSTCLHELHEVLLQVYPACAGIHPLLAIFLTSYECLPRMRGDPPPGKGYGVAPIGSTPHARGSTMFILTLIQEKQVYPACAGIHPSES